MSQFKKAMLVSLLIVVLMGIGAVIIIQQINDDETASGDDERSIDDMIAHSHETSDITTNLNDGTFVRIQFQIITDSEQATEEVAKREFQFKNTLIKEMSAMEESDFNSGLDELESDVKNILNEKMTDGTITDVYTISKVMQ